MAGDAAIFGYAFEDSDADGTAVVSSLHVTEDFDGVSAPDIPALWSVDGAPSWITKDDLSDSGQNAAFISDDTNSLDTRLVTPRKYPEGSLLRLSFQHQFTTQSGRDGGVLEVSFGGRRFIDILDAGGRFLQGGYNDVIAEDADSRLRGRQAWTGDSGGFKTSVVEMPAPTGLHVRFRWRFSTDSSESVDGGWRVDTVQIADILVNEQPLSGASVSLTGDVDGDGDTETISTQTDEFGEFQFVGLSPGPYQIEHAAPQGFTSLSTAAIPLEVGEAQDLVAYAGQSQKVGPSGAETVDPRLLIGMFPHASFTGRVAADASADGIPDDDEAFVGNRIVELLDSSGEVVDSTVSGGDNGEYELHSTQPGVFQVRLADPHDPDASPDAQHTVQAERLRIVAFGDSTTSYRPKNGESGVFGDAGVKIFAHRLPELLAAENYNAFVINAGVGATHTGNGVDAAGKRNALERFQQAARDPKPDLVTIQFGWNDSWILSTDVHAPSQISLAEYTSNLRFMTETLMQDGAKVILMTPNPPGDELNRDRAARTSEYAQAVRDLAADIGVSLVDPWNAYYEYASVEGQSINDLVLGEADVHPNDAGHELTSQLLMEEIRRLTETGQLPQSSNLDLADSAFGQISGQAFHDGDRDGVQGDSEDGLRGQVIELIDSAGKVIVTTTTSAIDFNEDGVIDPYTEAGHFSFPQLEAGMYQLRTPVDGAAATTSASSVIELTQGRTQASNIRLGVGMRTTITETDLANAVAAAHVRLRDAGFSPDDLAAISSLAFSVAELAEGLLTATDESGRVLVSRDADGAGWFMDSSLDDDREFGHYSPNALLSDDPAAADRIDLLSAIILHLRAYLDTERTPAGGAPITLPSLSSNVILPGARLVHPESPPRWWTEQGISVGVSSSNFSMLGTDRDELVTFHAGTNRHAVSYAGELFTLDATLFDEFSLLGGGGKDQATFFGTAGDEQFIARAGSATMQGAAFLVSARGFERTTAWAGDGGDDKATLYDDVSDDLFIGRAHYAYLSGDNFLNEAHAFDSVRAVSSLGGTDIARLYDSDSDDRLIARPKYAYLIDPSGRYNQADQFDRVYAYASGGRDTAILYDSTGDDVFVGRDGYSFMSGEGFTNEARHFESVRAIASAGGRDIAKLYDSPANDRFVARSEYAYLDGPGFLNEVRQFDSVRAFANAGGSDRAWFFDSAGDDLFVSRATFAYLLGDDNVKQADGFEWVRARALHGGHDEALFSDSAGDDLFVGRAAYSYLISQGRVAQADGFDIVRAQALHGGYDEAKLFGDENDDRFVGRPTYAYLQGNTYLNQVDLFDRVTAEGHGGFDRADLFGDEGDNRFVGRPTYAYLEGDAYLHQANHFERVTAEGRGGNDRAELFGDENDNRFVGRPTYAYLDGDAFLVQVNRFARVTADGGGGEGDVAWLFDSSGDDEFVGRDKSSYLLGDDFFNIAAGFARVVARSQAGGADYARLYDSPGDDAFFGRLAYAYLSSDTVLNETYGFDSVDAFSREGRDVAHLFGTDAVDEFEARPDTARVQNADAVNRIFGFRDVRNYGRGGNDTASLYGEEDAVFQGGMHGGELANDSLRIQAYSMNELNVFSSDGGRAQWFGSDAMDTIVSRRSITTFQRPGVLVQLHGFGSILADGQGGGDQARLYDIEDGDVLSADGLQLTLRRGDSLLELIEFGHVLAEADEGASPAAEVDAIDFVLEFAAQWLPI